MTNQIECNPNRDKIILDSIRVSNERTVTFATAGDPDGTPVLIFYPLGGNRRMLLSFHQRAVTASLKLICVNRPGMGGTFKAPHKTPASHMSTACNDIIAVLDALDISCVGLLFECAGAPFALAFAAKYKNRTIGSLMGIAPFVQPADCPRTKTIFQFGALRCPLWLISPFVANSIGSLTSLPSGWLNSHFKKSLTRKEYDFFVEASSEREFFDTMKWVYEEKGDTSADISVLLSKGVDIGIEYKHVHGKVVIFHPEQDKITPIAAGKWLSEQLPFGRLVTLPDASHEGALFMLHTPIVDSLKSLGTSS
mmetsp:Transcript_3387/g.6163  ORF Transcript_3387/g.6163 Transcript_3387/m.6163 type:complete len:309 (-) Transcript_3387:78-1004(-)